MPSISGINSRPTPVAQTNQFQARARQSTAANLTLTTAEGDQVTLSFRQDSRARLSPGRASAAQQTEVAVKVEGNLSDEEVQDIQELLGKLSEGVKSLNQGDPAAALQKLDAIDDLGSIQSFDFAYRRRTDVAFRGTQFSLDA